MKLITWNCQGAFRKKNQVVLEHRPDILVIQECEHTDKLGLGSTIPQPNDFYWYGDSIHKGIAIYSYSDYRFELLPDFNPEFRYVLPFRVTKNGQSFILFAIWAMHNKQNYEARYIGQVWHAINYYTSLLSDPILLIGDFNSNKIWDYDSRVGNHSDVVNKLSENNIHSIYHHYFNIEQGKEKHPTFFLQRKLNKPYHIDYCFASADFIDKVQGVEIGTYEKWALHSDHSPLIITIDV